MPRRKHYKPNRLLSNLLHVVGATAAELVSRSADVLVEEIERETPNLPAYLGIEDQVDAIEAAFDAIAGHRGFILIHFSNTQFRRRHDQNCQGQFRRQMSKMQLRYSPVLR